MRSRGLAPADQPFGEPSIEPIPRGEISPRGEPTEFREGTGKVQGRYREPTEFRGESGSVLVPPLGPAPRAQPRRGTSISIGVERETMERDAATWTAPAEARAARERREPAIETSETAPGSRVPAAVAAPIAPPRDHSHSGECVAEAEAEPSRWQPGVRPSRLCGAAAEAREGLDSAETPGWSAQESSKESRSKSSGSSLEPDAAPIEGISLGAEAGLKGSSAGSSEATALAPALRP